MNHGRQLGSLRSRIVIGAVVALTFAGVAVVPRLAQAVPNPTVDVNPAPGFTNNNANVTEGNFGNAPVNVLFKLSQDNTVAVTVHYQTTDGTAKQPGDYAEQHGDVVFNPHETSKSVVFNAKGDTIDEPDEVFNVTITGVDANADNFVAGHNGTVTILDDDAAPSVSLVADPVTEGNPGDTPTEKFTATMSSPAGQDTTFYAFSGPPTNDTDPNTQGVQPPPAATAGTDYTAQNGGTSTLVIKAGDRTGTMTVPILPDTTDEFDEYFDLALKATDSAGAPNVALTQGHIVDDDAAPRVDVADPAPVNEGDTACGHLGDPQPTCNNPITFTITLSQPSAKRIVVDYSTADRTATSGSNTASDDYIGKSGSGDPSATPPGSGQVFLPGETSHTVTAQVRGDTVQEPDEFFVLNIDGASNATIGDGQAQGLIRNDDGGSFPTVSVNNAPTVAEASGGTPGTSTFTITVSRPQLPTVNTSNVRVFFQTADGPESGSGAAATAGSDYVAKANGSFVDINFPQTTATVTVSLINDSKHEPDEFYQLQLTAASNSAITDAVGEAKITDDDPAPTISIADKTVTEGNTGLNPSTTASLAVTLSAASGEEIDVVCSEPQPNSGTATAGNDGDYTPIDRTIVFQPGETSKTCDVPVVGDTVDEDNETVNVVLQSPTGATINDGSATLTITDDDNPPTINIANVALTEGSSTNTTAKFTVLLSGPSSKTITAHVATADGTAKAPGDYTANAADLTFAPGETSKEFDVTVIADTLDEPNETFTAALSALSATVTAGSQTTATGTIVDDDDGPSLSINNVTVTEGNSGTTNAIFTVTKTGTTAQTVGVHFATADGTATTADSDYVATSGDLSFAPADTTKTITVAVNGDTKIEPDETFSVNLTAPTFGATVSDGTGTGTISNDEGVPTVGVSNAACTEGDKCTFTFTLSNTSLSDVTVNYSTADGTATSSGDYTAVPAGIATITAGQTTTTADVQTTEDTTHESTENFSVTINSATGATVDQAHKTGTGTITDDDGPVTAAEITTAVGPGGGPHVKTFAPGSTTVKNEFFDGNPDQEHGGKHVARGDVDGDGIDEIITGSGQGDAAVLTVRDAHNPQTVIASTFAYLGGSFYGGVFVAAAPDHDGKALIVTGAGPGGGPHVRTWKVVNGQLVMQREWFAYDANFTGGISVAAGDVNGDGYADVITGAGKGGGPHVQVFSGAPADNNKLLASFFAYRDPSGNPTWTGGINVAAGDLTGDGKADIATTPWPGGGPHLRLFKADTFGGTAIDGGGIFVPPSGFTGGLTVAIGDLNGDGIGEIVVGAMSGTTGIQAFKADLTAFPNENFKPWPDAVHNGNWVAVGKA